MTTGERMKQRRKELGFSAEKVAERLGVSPATIYRYERGDIEKVPGDSLGELAKILQTTPAYLMGWEEKPTAPAPRPIPKGFEPMPKMKKIPLVGSIACGTPILAQQNIEKIVDVPENIRCDFSLTCHGDSMEGAGIHDRDVVYIRIQPEVENGEIAAVLIDSEEATLKRVKIFDDHIVLEPENPMYKPLVFWGEEMNNVRILGKATHFISALK